MDSEDKAQGLAAEPDPSLVVDDNIWVSVVYRLFDLSGNALDDVARNLTYLHGGYGEVLPKIEALLSGKSTGADCSIQLEPDDAFGDYDENLITMLPVERLPPDSQVGMTFEGIPGEADDGRVYTVTDMAQGQAVLDGNHPLAGIGLRYELSIESLRSASDEEIVRETQARDASNLSLIHI